VNYKKLSFVLLFVVVAGSGFLMVTGRFGVMLWACVVFYSLLAGMVGQRLGWGYALFMMAIIGAAVGVDITTPVFDSPGLFGLSLKWQAGINDLLVWAGGGLVLAALAGAARTAKL